MPVRLSLFIIMAATVLPAASADTLSSQSELVDRLKAGGHILMIRHAIAPGNGDPANFTLGDCKTQRNLDASGRAQARKIGKWLRTRGIDSARVYSSQWCRCLETAHLIGLGTVQELSALNSFYERNQDRDPNLRALHDFISRQPTEGRLIILVTHFVTVDAMTRIGVASGEGVLLKLHQDKPYTVVDRLDFGSAHGNE